VVFFENIFRSAFKSSELWYAPGHMGHIVNWYDAPSFPDWNGDGVLDVFTPMHTSPPRPNLEPGWDFGIASGDGDDFDHFVYRNASLLDYRDPDGSLRCDECIERSDFDLHGSAILDIDGDGFLDLFIVQGGAQGITDAVEMDPSYQRSFSRANMLFWGGLDENGDFRLVGGRNAAIDAGLGGWNGRGRFSYWADFNGDGALDVFFFQDRRRDDILAVGETWYNDHSRHFIEDPNMKEFARTGILYDADGDGYAEEFVLQRGHCYPQNTDTGTYLDERKEFCRSRPQSSQVIYKFNGEYMEIISEIYDVSMEEDVGREGESCIHGSWIDVNCHSYSSASGDFDGDQKADLVVTFGQEVLFYFSSNREEGQLPKLDEPDLIIEFDEQEIVIAGIRFVDFNLDGVQEFIVFDVLQTGRHQVYKFVEGSWIRETETMGALHNIRDLRASEAHLDTACDVDSSEEEDFDFIFRDRNFNVPCFGEWRAIPMGAAVVDLNNDGYFDVVIPDKYGLLGIYRNIPTVDNKYIAFQLKGVQCNEYGIGATLIFQASNMETNEFQFQEVNSYSHPTDKMGGQDNRVVFGLGPAGVPERLTVRWPIPVHAEQVVDLRNFSGEGAGTMVDPFIIVEDISE